jgi:DNA-binding LacI/PurR family transcriptional regulator
MKEKAKSRARANSVSTGSRPTIVDVARRAKVSVATVSNALTGRRSVDPVTGAHVKATARELGYMPNLRARRLRTGRADTIAIFSSMPFAIAGGRARLGFLMEVAAAAATQALQSGIALILIPPVENSRPPLDDLHIDGALVVEPAAQDPDVALLKTRGIPVVAIGRQAAAQDIPFVDLRSYDAARLLLDHLRAQAARRIALMIGLQVRNSYAEAERAHRDFAAKHRMRPVIRRVDELGGEAAGCEAALALLREHPELDAICATVDVFAVGAAAAAAQLGRTVPDDLKLATRYNGLRAQQCDPPLTALDLHLDEVAVAGVELLLEHMRAGETRGSIRGPMPTVVPRISSTKAGPEFQGRSPTHRRTTRALPALQD